MIKKTNPNPKETIYSGNKELKRLEIKISQEIELLKFQLEEIKNLVRLK